MTAHGVTANRLFVFPCSIAKSIGLPCCFLMREGRPYPSVSPRVSCHVCVVDGELTFA
jgi:hypothetical protein